MLRLRPCQLICAQEAANITDRRFKDTVQNASLEAIECREYRFQPDSLIGDLRATEVNLAAEIDSFVKKILEDGLTS